MNEANFGDFTAVPNPQPLGSKTPQTPAMAPVILTFEGRLRDYDIAAASVTAASGLV